MPDLRPGPHEPWPRAELPPPGSTVPFRARGFAPRTIPGAGAATLVALVLAWQAAAAAGWIDTRFLPPPLAIARALYALIASGELWGHLAASLRRLAIGWSIGSAAGIALGLAVGLSTLARAPGLAVVSALFPIPKIALVPLFIIWFGIGEGSKVVTLAFGTFFPTVLTVAAGVDALPRSLIRMAQAFGLSRAAIVLKVVIPGILPAILASVRLTSAIAIILLVAAEMIGADQGIGAFVLQAGNLYDTDNLLAGIVCLSVLGLSVAWLIGRLEGLLLAWR